MTYFLSLSLHLMNFAKQDYDLFSAWNKVSLKM